MAEKLDPRQVVTFEELLRAMMFEMVVFSTLAPTMSLVNLLFSAICA